MSAHSKASARPGGHMQALTGIRGIAAWYVVLYHARLSMVSILPPAAIAALSKGYLAVDLFFVLSGFVMWYNYAARLHSGGSAAIGDFLWRRIARIWPLHLFILSLFLAFVVLLRATGRDTGGYPLGELPLHALLIQNWGFTSELSWNHPAWSISTELAAYIAFPLLAFGLRRASSSGPALGALALLLLAVLHGVFHLAGAHGLGDYITHLGLVRCLVEFSVGCIVCLVWELGRTIAWSARLAGLATLLALGIGIMTGLPETAYIPATFACAILALALGTGPVVRALSGRVIVYLGEISYSTYLVHFLFFIVFKIAFVDATLQIGWGGLAAYATGLLIASVALYHLVEKPAQRWFNRHRPWRRDLPAATAAE